MLHDFITPRELEANLNPIREDVSEIKLDVKTLMVKVDALPVAQAQAQYQNSFLGGRGHTLFVAVVPALISGAVALAVGFIFY